MKYDAIVIGAGMSGFGAGIRLAHYGKKVCIIEQHTLAGGLNSHYAKDGRRFDVGLHAMTNFAKKNKKQAPLNKLLRQLRIPYDSLDLVEQNYSKIIFLEKQLLFGNDDNLFEMEIAKIFPAYIDAYKKLQNYIITYDDVSLHTKYVSARQIVSSFIKDPLLVEMIFCPLMYYGSAVESDMDFSQFCTMFKSIFLEGFCRPQIGVRHLLRILNNRYCESGGEIYFSSSVKKILIKNKKVNGVQLENGDVLEASNFFSSAGLVETIEMIGEHTKKIFPVGKLSFVETILILKNFPKQWNSDETIIFFNNSSVFNYRCPRNELVDYSSGVICYPNNFNFKDKPLKEGIIRITNLANYHEWEKLSKQKYQDEKKIFIKNQIKALENLNNCLLKIEYTDAFTPLTIKKFSRHKAGAIYGSPYKAKNGLIGYDNLYIIGTDQGFLGIVGALLSGISMANLYGLR